MRSLIFKSYKEGKGLCHNNEYGRRWKDIDVAYLMIIRYHFLLILRQFTETSAGTTGPVNDSNSVPKVVSFYGLDHLICSVL
jgi:hypothetical protein